MYTAAWHVKCKYRMTCMCVLVRVCRLLSTVRQQSVQLVTAAASLLSWLLSRCVSSQSSGLGLGLKPGTGTGIVYSKRGCAECFECFDLGVQSHAMPRLAITSCCHVVVVVVVVVRATRVDCMMVHDGA